MADALLPLIWGSSCLANSFSFAICFQVDYAARVSGKGASFSLSGANGLPM